jgi:hypothetical protein
MRSVLRFPRRPSQGELFSPPRRSQGTSSGGVSSAHFTHARASSEGVSGRPRTTSGPCATTRSRLACLRQGLPAVQARGYDDLSAETLARFEDAHVGAIEPGALRAALAASVLALMREGAEAVVPHALVVAARLAELR